MLFREELTLTTLTHTTNTMGDPVTTETDVIVFADKKSVGQKEFYQASAQGLKPEMAFVVRTCDYSQQALAKWNGKRYKILRTYDRNDEFTELVLMGVTNGVI